jgi:hypothetical protein
MPYLKNGSVNLLNLHYGLRAFAMNGAGVFWAVYLLKAGVPQHAVFASIGLLLGMRFLFRPAILLVAPRLGLRRLVAFGAILGALPYVLLAQVHGVDVALLALCVVGALADTVYWTSFHAYFASLGDVEHRGKQVSAREALVALTGIVGPLVVGWTLVALGPQVAFGIAAIVQALSALAFFWTPEVAVKPVAPNAFRSALPATLVFATDGWIAGSAGYAWQIALFLTLGESFTAFGGARRACGARGRGVGPCARSVHRRWTRRSRGMAHLWKPRRVDPAARGEHRHGGSCGGRKRAGRTHRLPLRADVDDGGIQSGEALAVPVALPRDDGRWLGHRRRPAAVWPRQRCPRLALHCRRRSCWGSRASRSRTSCSTATIRASGLPRRRNRRNGGLNPL